MHTPPNASLNPGPRYNSADNHEVKLALFDVDNTLIDNESPGLPSPAFQQAAADARLNGITVGLVSARPLSKTSHILDSIGASGLSIISNGAQIIDSSSREIVAEWPLNQPLCLQV